MTGEQKMQIEELLAEGKTVQIKPQGYSMYPLFIPGRDEAVIAPVSGKKLKRGDVILYRREQSILVLHRIWKCRKDGYYLVGDNQEEIEGPITEEQVKGILTFIIRKGKTFSTRHILYRFFAGIWLFLRPLRGVIKRPVAKIKRGVKACFGKKKN